MQWSINCEKKNDIRKFNLKVLSVKKAKERRIEKESKRKIDIEEPLCVPIFM